MSYTIWRQRITIRNEFQIPALDFQDIIIALYCTPCALSQMARHIYSYRSRMSHDEYSCTVHGTPRWQLDTLRNHTLVNAVILIEHEANLNASVVVLSDIDDVEYSSIAKLSNDISTVQSTHPTNVHAFEV